MNSTLSKLIIIVFLLAIGMAVLYVGGFLPTYTSFPNMYKGEVVFYEYCPNYPKYCHVMKALPDKDTGKAHSISEGTITADRPIKSATLRIYYDMMAIETGSYSHLIVWAWNYKKNRYVPLFEEEVKPKWEYSYTYDVGDIMPRRKTRIERYGECYSYEYREYMKKSCTCRVFNLTSDYIAEDQKTMKFKLDMYAQGRYMHSYYGKVAVESMWADFNYIEEPEEQEQPEEPSEQEPEPSPSEEPEEHEPTPSFWQRIWMAILNFLNMFKIR